MATTNSINDRARTTTRRELRAHRKTLDRSTRRTAQRAIARNLLRARAYRRAHTVAVYFSVDGEVDLSSIIEHSRTAGKSVFVPVLARQRLRFVELSGRTRFKRNRFGIPEPAVGRQIDPRELDIVLTPLVAFDGRGNRLGMGKGYYDRSFEFLRRRAHWRKPKLIGIGFDFQKLDLLDSRDWDVPLWSAVTDNGIDYF